MEHVGLEFTEVGEDFIKATLPVDHRTQQPLRTPARLSASCVLAETLGSVASAMVVDHDQYMTLGIEINANHMRAMTEGPVTGTCKPLQLGKTLHVLGDTHHRHQRQTLLYQPIDRDGGTIGMCHFWVLIIFFYI